MLNQLMRMSESWVVDFQKFHHDHVWVLSVDFTNWLGLLFICSWETNKFPGPSSNSVRRSWMSRRPGRGRGRWRRVSRGCSERGSWCAVPRPWRTSGPSLAPWAGPARGRGARSSSPGSRLSQTRLPSRQRDWRPQVTSHLRECLQTDFCVGHVMVTK